MQSEEDMKKIGISKSNSIKLNALTSLCKRGVKKETSEQMNSPKKIYNLCKDLEEKDQEILRLICLNSKNKVIYQEDIFKGGLSSSIAHPREILKVGLKCSAANIIIVHNHPSGDPTPSKEDINITVRIKEAGSIIGIELLDHLIIGKNRYVSLKEKGIL